MTAEDEATRLTVDLAILDGNNVLKLSGDLDVSTSTVLNAKVGVVHGPVLVDCDQLRFVDSNGFAALAELRDRADSVVLWRPSIEIREVLHVMNIGGAVSILVASPRLMPTAAMWRSSSANHSGSRRAVEAGRAALQRKSREYRLGNREAAAVGRRL